jgi:hypothetical protein
LQERKDRVTKEKGEKTRDQGKGLEVGANAGDEGTERRKGARGKVVGS